MIFYVDVDDTLIRSVGKKITPIVSVINKIKELKQRGDVFYCWSTGGADYAKRVVQELNLTGLFEACLPKPHIMIDDQPFLGKVVYPWEVNEL